MFDEILYKVLDKIVTTCECLKKCIKERSLPDACTNDDVKKEEVKNGQRVEKRSINNTIIFKLIHTNIHTRIYTNDKCIRTIKKVKVKL